jgi:alginate O-acetyltransferase complex protein AlgJ
MSGVSDEAGLDQAHSELGFARDSKAPAETVDAGGNGTQPQVGVPARYVADGKVVEGRGGRLFLANDDNHAFEQYTGERLLEDWKLEFWGKVLAARSRSLRSLGIQYVFLVAPDSHPVHPDLLPPGVKAAPERPVDQLMGYVDRHRIPVPFVYPLEELRAEQRRGRTVYPDTDSHWNDFGGFVAYESVMDRIERVVPVRRVTEPEVIFYDVVVEGDLGFKLDPVRSSAYATAAIRHPSARLLEDNRIEGKGGLVVTECPAAPPVTCVLFGDSYTYALLKYLSESFRRLVFAHTPWIDAGLIDRERPAMVLSLMVERHLVGVPNDAEGETLEESAARKVKQSRFRPGLDHWDEGPALLSPANVERVRAHLRARGRLLDATIVSVLAYAGLRPREMLALHWSDLKGDTLVAGRRTVPVFEALASDLREWRAAQAPVADDALVFPRLATRGRAELRDWKRDVLQPTLRNCGIPEESADLLHRTFASLLIHAGANPKEVARHAGSEAAAVKAEYKVLFGLALKSEPVSPDEQIATDREAYDLGGSSR